jgi:putative membrane protein
MISRSGPTFTDILFAMRGSIIPRIAWRLLLIVIVSAGAVLLARTEPKMFFELGAMPFTLIGIALSIFMSFRNSACYDRWWEARKLWGQLIVSSRSFARQIAAIDPAERDPMLLGLCGFAGGLAARLRNEDEVERIGQWSDAARWAAQPNPTDAVLADIGRRCTDLAAAGTIRDIHYSVLEGQLTQIGGVQAGCERIKTTPLPFAYALLLHRTAYMFCLLLPFALAGSLGWWTPLLVLVVSYTFFGLDALGDELEDPFGYDPNDLPLDAMVRLIERELLAAAGRTELPPAILPTNYVLH